MLGAEVRQVDERADEPKTASYSIQAKLLKLFVQRPFAVWALDHVAWVGRINKDQGDPECEV
jgi:hypothetical protein